MGSAFGTELGLGTGGGVGASIIVEGRPAVLGRTRVRGGVEQMAACLAHNQEVDGSSPSPAPRVKFLY